jgi:hypothetical protein
MRADPMSRAPLVITGIHRALRLRLAAIYQAQLRH